MKTLIQTHKVPGALKASIYLGNGSFTAAIAVPAPDRGAGKGGVYELRFAGQWGPEYAYDPAIWLWSKDEIRGGVMHVCRG